MKLKKGDIVTCICDHEGVLYSLYLKIGDKYYISEFEGSDKIHVESMWHDYYGCYSITWFFTKKQIRKMKLENINENS